MRRALILSLLMLAPTALLAAPATAPSTSPSPVRIQVSTSMEEGKPVLRADVTVDDKPLKATRVQFLVKRTFGNVILGDDQTDDDGSAVVKFPADLPGGPHGELDVIARIVAPAAYQSSEGRAIVNGGVPVIPGDRPAFPRAMWAPHAPWPLVIVIASLLGGVWTAYLYAFLQLVRIRKGA